MMCPNCGKRLARLTAPNAETPPWLCADCSRGWWPSELTVEARRLWDPATRSHGTSEAAEMVRLQAMVEHDDSKRGEHR